MKRIHKPLTDDQIAKKLEDAASALRGGRLQNMREDMRIPSTHQRG